MDYDLIIIGSGPGGYVAAIRASQLKMKTAVIEKAEIGGICLNWGCIPTKSLLKSSQVMDYINHASDYGITIEGVVKSDFNAIITRSRSVADSMSKGVSFLFRKNKIDLINGTGKLTGNNSVEVKDGSGQGKTYTSKNIILATGARSKEIPGLVQDGIRIIGYREAMTLGKQPRSMVVVGSGAIGSEFASFYQSIGTEVTLVEFLPRVVPNEDEEISKQLERSFKKMNMRVLTDSKVDSVDTSGENCKVRIKTPDGLQEIESDIVFSAVGITPNIDGLGLEEAKVEIENGKIKVDKYYKTTADAIYAIGDIVSGQALAHVASAEGIICVEKIAGLDPEPLNYNNIPACTYTNPEIASCGLTEAAAKAAGFDIKVGKFPFTASGKANASGSREGFVKLIFDSAYGELLGAHMIGANVTEMISEIVVARKLETTAHEIIKSVHPHPTMSEAIMEAAAAAYGEVIHI
jgi:dihydrolipoamide dehydrogenase